MHYLHLISAFAGEIWAIEPTKLAAIVDFLAFKAGGGELSQAEIAARLDGRRAAGVARKEGDVAVLPLVGLISPRASMVSDASTGDGGVSAEAWVQRLEANVQDESVKAIVIDTHSPGGNVHGVEVMATALRNARGSKPIIAQVNSLAASAAYWVISGADEIVLTPGAEAGSIGVYTVHEDISRKLEKDGVTATLLKVGANKAEMNNLSPLSSEAREATERRIRTHYDAFVGAVAAGRGVSVGEVEDRMGQGRVFGGKDLIERKMADRFGTLQETLARLGAGAPARAQQRSRDAFAAGGNPSLATVEEVLRDAGFPKSLAVDFVSHGKGAFRRSESGAETEADAMADLRQAVAGLRQLRS